LRQNTSHAVMAQRHEPHDSLDFFGTPAWATGALCEMIDLRGLTVWEPAAGAGDMARPLAEYARVVVPTDVHDYGEGFAVADFLGMVPVYPAGSFPVIATNPPFRLGAAFALRALDLAGSVVAMFVRSVFTEGAERYRSLFTPHPPAFVAQFVERVPINKGRPKRDATTATAYSWVVWQRGYAETAFKWIPPCRKRLERDEDYQ
jgi:hypothetical protein